MEEKKSANALLEKGVTSVTPLNDSLKSLGMDSKGPNEKPMGISKTSAGGKFKFK